ncbi:MAG: hypothetical protein VYC68_00190, partial [Candidatus Thermoplasmatota archaeon]|nr:hypothetical protein [Candidatus Thermoplasmatota archaeon]
VDDKDALKADAATSYLKTEVDGLLAGKLTEVLAGNGITVSANGSVRTVTSTVNPADYALQAATYTKTEVDNKDALKADAATTYTKTEVDNKDALKADAATTYTKT